MRKAIHFRRQTRRFEEVLEEKRLQEMRKSDKQQHTPIEELRQVVQQAARKIRPSLVVIKAYANLLKHYDGAEKEEALEHMKQSALKVERILHEMIDLVQLQNVDGIPKEHLDFEGILEEVKQHLTHDRAIAAITFQHTFSVPTIYYNRFQIFSLLYAALDNCLHHRKENEALIISIRSYCDGQYTVLEIADNGKGFKVKKNKEMLFQPFAKTAVNKNRPSTGLYLLKTIIEKNGGYVHIQSKENAGTVLSLFFKTDT